jgi:acyl-CoA thioesterase-1
VTPTGVRLSAHLALLLLAGCATPARPATLAPAPTPVVVTLGDSVPAGSACGCDPFPHLYARAQHAADVNLAEPGYTAADVLADLPADTAVLASAAEVLLMVGANDLADAFDDDEPYASAAATVRKDVAATITAIERIQPVPVIVIGYWNVVLDGRIAAQQYSPAEVRDAAEATQAANDALQEAARQTGARYVPTGTAFHGVDGERDPTGMLAPDGDHPNAAGHAAIAALLPPLPSG